MTEGYATPEGTLVRSKLWFDDGFTRVPNTWIRDKRMSFKARGVLMFLLSHEAGFKVTIRSIAGASTDGRDAVTTGVTELEKLGYLKRSARRAAGRNLGTAWVLQDPFAPGPERLPGLSTGGGLPANSGSSYPQVADYPGPENPVPKEDQLKKISNHLPKVTTDRTRAALPVWSETRCPGNWRDGTHELGRKTGKCLHCYVAPVAFATETGELA
ncbi:helix-turn-helix domain-containing protein [Microbacterium sp. cx-55]|uniref:helix-turn-helix domain-containing protein n=1 Tax=Microbacterium sp. cx-55 TaxID=2875948 RepID=UPI001CBAF5BD|nr:helix-turn-helix domain-containing protein [Microbacterium sp. cx-55]MBZ4486267.1 helix-turn-helix domain-containing protein [Microbacterium sp. cx-55]